MTSKTPQKRGKTEPGLGIPRINTAEISRTTDSSPASVLERTGARRLRDTLRREEDDAEVPPASSRTERSYPSASGTSGVRSPRPAPVTVDKVGAGAAKLSARKNVPQRIAAKVAIEKAPLDTRSAFILSLVDGINGVDSLVDVSGMSDSDVKAILERLARLGLISLP